MLTLFHNSSSDVFFDWKEVGTLSEYIKRINFTYNKLPSLIVIAASSGSSEYPTAYSYNPIPPTLSSTTGTSGAFIAEPTPYAAASIFVTPDVLTVWCNNNGWSLPPQPI